MKLLSSLPFAFFAGHALAQCDIGPFSGSTNWADLDIYGACNLKQDNVYYCGDSGTTIVHKQSQFMLRAGKADSTIAVFCANKVTLVFHYGPTLDPLLKTADRLKPATPKFPFFSSRCAVRAATPISSDNHAQNI
ncbi:hypothetical protein E4U28_000327 [Claviceps purpurea]|nr:hypothetical protein E4U28_000327 [Claviceps purpurea]